MDLIKINELFCFFADISYFCTMNQQQIDEMYMQRCLQLARNGMQNAKPNPMVGAVIVISNPSLNPSRGRGVQESSPRGGLKGGGFIIGEGYHVRCGEGHAEVNAFASVRPEDEPLLKDATIYVSLEPCAHYGKTPPCCDLIIKKGVKRCVVGCVDPFAKVQGRGIQKIREAGIEVTVGVLEEECRALNKRFFTFHEKHRPYILLKWAQTGNGFIDDHGKALAISTPYTKMLVHKLRSEYDAILVGRVTDEREHPQLNVREWSGKDPKRIVLSSGNQGAGDCLQALMEQCYEANIQSLMVEGGRKTLQSFIDSGLWDEIRVETAPMTVTEGTTAPQLPTDALLCKQEEQDGNTLSWYSRK